jgi:predicted RNA-binding Zn ribbon-like protein
VSLPPWVPEIEDKPAPMPLLVMQSFVNTLDADLGTDAFATDDQARAWLVSAGLLAPEARITREDLELMRAARESFRSLVDRQPPGDPLAAILADHGPRMRLTADGRVVLDTEAAGVPAGILLRLLLIVRDAQADGTWERLRLCANPDCRWVFYDRSHARRGQWCDMNTCGNRIKNRNLRARRSADKAVDDSSTPL